LEEEIAHLPPKIFKATTTLLNMRSSEQELCEFKRFEEAKVVKSHADRLDTEERGEFQRKMAASQTAQRELLEALHTSKQDEHERHMKRNELHLKNHGEINMQQTRWRLKQNDQNMLHAHSLGSMAKPVFSYKSQGIKSAPCKLQKHSTIEPRPTGACKDFKRSCSRFRALRDTQLRRAST
jgi:hypothetical protein